MNKKIILLVLGVVSLLSIQAQKTFTLEEAVTYALENNKQLKSKRYDVQKSESKYKETRAAWMPQVDATVDYMTYFGYEAEFAIGGETPTFGADDIFNATIAAGDAYVDAGGNPDGYDAAQYAGSNAFESSLQSTLPPTTIDMGGASTAKLQVGQMLFNGQLLSGIRAAKIGMALAEQSIELSELDVRYNVATTYYSELTLQATLATIDSSLLEMQSLVLKTEVMVRTGIMELTELDQLKVQLNSLKNTKLAMGRNVQLTYNLLRFHLGLPVNDPIVLTDDLDLIMEAIIGENALAETFDITNNLNYLIVEKQVALTEEMVN
ncbi:MAG: TolC family protein, partial [Bacteroidales bacterium]|nr:TolC family protein [Bacteroidales bacterium]